MEDKQAGGRQTVTLTVPETLQKRLRTMNLAWEWLNDPEFWETILEQGVAKWEREQQELGEMLRALESSHEE
ncbi:MAG: hypothetical protein IPK66_03405 [Rhodospirillales bacterium]|nr:hypothetical protein [Rhodospirillales bacterium]